MSPPRAQPLLGKDPSTHPGASSGSARSGGDADPHVGSREAVTGDGAAQRFTAHASRSKPPVFHGTKALPANFLSERLSDQSAARGKS